MGVRIVSTYRSAKKATLKRGTQLEYFKKGNRDGYSGIRKQNGRDEAGGEPQLMSVCCCTGEAAAVLL